MNGGDRMSVPENFKADIQEGQRLRGWIANAYAQFEFLLDDLILRCSDFPEYNDETKHGLTRDALKRLKRVRTMLKKAGPLDAFSKDLSSIIHRFEGSYETRNLLAHGFCTFLYTPNGDTALQFQKWHRHDDREDARLIKQFRLDDLERERKNLTDLSNEAMHLFQQMHQHFGWEERPDR